MLNERYVWILFYLINQKDPIPLSVMADAFKCSIRTLRTDIENINSLLNENKIGNIGKTKDKKLFLQQRQKEQIEYYIENGEGESYILSPEERVYVISLLILMSEKKLNIQMIGAQLDISVSTVKNDIPKVRKWLAGEGISLITQAHEGTYIEADEQGIRRAALSTLTTLVSNLNYNIFHIIRSKFTYLRQLMKWVHLTSFKVLIGVYGKQIYDLIQYLQSQDGSKLTDNSFCITFLYLLIAAARISGRHSIGDLGEKKIFNSCSKRFLPQPQSCFLLSDPEFAGAEWDYLNLIWICCSRYEGTRNISIVRLEKTRKFVTCVGKKIGVSFCLTDDEYLCLATNIEACYARAVLGVAFCESECGDVRSNDSIPRLEAEVQKQLGRGFQEENEGRYARNRLKTDEITAQLERCIDRSAPPDTPATGNRGKDIIIVCNYSLGTSKLIAQKLQRFFSGIRSIRLVPSNKFLQNPESYPYDVCLSTVPLKEENCILIEPSLPESDMARLEKEFTRRETQISEAQYLDATINLILCDEGIDPEQKLKTLLFLMKSLPAEIERIKENQNISFQYLLPMENIQTGVIAESWQEAIQATGDLLRRKGYIRQSHIDEMIELCRKYNSYIVIDDRVAMPHIMAADILVPSISIAALSHPVRFDNGKSVTLLIMMVSNNNTSHVRALKRLQEILEDPLKRNGIITARSAEEIFKIWCLDS